MEIKLDLAPDGVAVVCPVGRLDAESAPSLKAVLSKAVAEGHSQLVVDLVSVSFMDSAGLGALIGGLKAARLAGGDVRIARPKDQARLVLELTRLDRVMRLYSTLEQALAA